MPIASWYTAIRATSGCCVSRIGFGRPVVPEVCTITTVSSSAHSAVRGDVGSGGRSMTTASTPACGSDLLGQCHPRRRCEQVPSTEPANGKGQLVDRQLRAERRDWPARQPAADDQGDRSAVLVHECRDRIANGVSVVIEQCRRPCGQAHQLVARDHPVVVDDCRRRIAHPALDDEGVPGADAHQHAPVHLPDRPRTIARVVAV